MSIFGSILGAIFGHAQRPQQPQATQQSHPAPGSQPGQTPSSAPSARPAQQQAKPASPPSAPHPVDVEAVLDKLKADRHANLDWRHSIVDLMKLLDLDSSLAARKELSQELHYTGDTHDSATMNIWLHKQVMAKLAENGGKVPENLKH
jgi:hypothetical protein